jgi:uncharacterized membrane protein YhaH (DUF805 family)
MKKVAIVGVEGSGKTVMLAGLGELYSHPDGNGYFLAPKNYETASYVSEKIARMRKGEWPMATAEDVMQGLDWTLRQRQGEGQRPRDVCEVSCLDFAGEVYRYAFVRQGAVPSSLEDEVSSLKNYVRDADDLIVLINLRDIIVRGAYDSRVQEAMWITNAILSYALDEQAGHRPPRAAIVLSQADSYVETIRSCGGPKGVLAKYLPHVANNYDWLDILALSAVEKTTLDDNGNVVPAPDFRSVQLRLLMDWIKDGLAVSMPPRARRPPPAPPRSPQGNPPAPQPHTPPPQPSGIGQYMTLRGRCGRAGLWRFIGFYFVGSIATGVILGETGFGLFVLAMIWPGFSVMVRRLHDMNRSGWWWLLVFIPFANWLFFIALCFVGGTRGYNDYGPRP